MSDKVLSITEVFLESNKGEKRKFNDIESANPSTNELANFQMLDMQPEMQPEILQENLQNPFKKFSSAHNSFINNFDNQQQQNKGLPISPNTNTENKNELFNTIINSSEIPIISSHILSIKQELKSSISNIQYVPFIPINIKDKDVKDAFFRQKLLCIFRALVYKNFDFSKNYFDINNGTILYNQIPRVSIHITHNEVSEKIMEYFDLLEKQTTINNGNTSLAHKFTMNILEKENKLLKEIIVNFGYPFYTIIRVNNKGGFTYYRKEPYSNLTVYENIDKIIYNTTNTSLNNLDLIMASNIIAKMVKAKFKNGNDFLSILIHCINFCKNSNDKILYSNKVIDFKGFYNLHQKIALEFEQIPIRN